LRSASAFTPSCGPDVDAAGGRSPAVDGSVAVAVANLAGQLPLSLTLHGQPRQAHCTYVWAAGGIVLTITTVIPERGLAFELISTYTGHRDSDTIAVHLALGRGRIGEIETYRHPRDELNPDELARACAYDHAHRLSEALSDSGRLVAVELDEHTFAGLERVE